MHFRVRKHRTTPGVIIVALVDVLIVLLIFLMVTTTFKQQAALRVSLPEAGHAQKSGASENPPFVVTIKADDDKIYYLEKLPMTFEQLRSTLQDRAAKNPNLILAINADEKAPWGKIVKVRDAAVEAKIKTFVAFTKDSAKP